ncbi:hypothetical protein JCM8208_004384 [Rhodotorula glutinis]
MSRAPPQDDPVLSSSIPPADGTCLLDRLPNEVVLNILSLLVPVEAPVAGEGARLDKSALLVLRQTCRLMNMLCARMLSRCRVIFEGADTQSEVAAQPFLSVVIPSAPRANSVRKLAFDDTSRAVLRQFLHAIIWWTDVLPNVEEVVLSGTQRVELDLNSLARFSKLRDLSIANADLVTISRNTRFRSLVTLGLSSVALSEPWLLSRWTMPALRHLSLVACPVTLGPYRKERWTTNLLPQLDILEIGESHKPDANVGLLVPLVNLPVTLPVLWRVDVDRALVRVPFLRPRAALLRHAFVRLTIADDAPTQQRAPISRPERLAKVLSILDLLPAVELLLVPHDFWHPPSRAEPARMSQDTEGDEGQQVVVDECARRGIEVRTYERREGGHDGVVPEFRAFLRETGLEGGTARAHEG